MPSSTKTPARYRPRDPRASPFYRLVQDHLKDFELSLKNDQRKDTPDPRIAGYTRWTRSNAPSAVGEWS